MADNTPLNPGSGGDTIATEDVGGVKYPISKIHTGAHAVDGGAVTVTNPFPVEISDGTTVATVKPASTAAASTDKALVVVARDAIPVTGTFFQGTQPVSGTVTSNVGTTGGLALDATLTGGTAQARITDGTNVASVKAASTAPATTDKALVTVISPNQAAIPVSGSFFQATQPVSIAASVPVTGTFWQTTQPVSGSVTANVGTTNGLALDATLTGGTQQVRITDGTRVGTVKAASTAAGATDTALVVAVSPNNSVAVTGTFWQATQPVSGTVAVTGTFWQSTQPVSIAAAVAVTQSSTWTVQPGNTPNTIPWLFKVSDGTNAAAIKAASTAAVATDPAIVVAVSPNNTVAVTGTFWQATQAVSGTVTANLGTVSGLALDATLTGGTQQARITDGTNVATVKAASTAAATTDKAVVVAVSPNNSVAVTGTFWQATQPVSGTVAVTGTFWQSTQPVSIAAAVATTQSGTWSNRVTDGTNTAAVKAASTAAVAADPALVVALSPNNNTLANALITKPGDGTNTVTVKASATAPVSTDTALVVAISPNFDGAPARGKGKATSSATTNIAAATTSTQLLAANTNRRGYRVYNSTTAGTLYLLEGSGTPSATNCVIPIAAGGYYEDPYGYTGQLQGLWSTTGGSANVTETT